MPNNLPRKGAYRCSMCSINYPVHKQFVKCPCCLERTAHGSHFEVHEDWLDRVMDAILTISGGIPNYVPDWTAYGDPPQET